MHACKTWNSYFENDELCKNSKSFEVHRLRLKSFTFCKANSKYIYSHGLRTALTQKEWNDGDTKTKKAEQQTIIEKLVWFSSSLPLFSKR